MPILINPKFMKSIASILLTLVICGIFVCRSSSNVNRAKAVFEEYIKALQRGFSTQAKTYWNKQELKQYKSFDWQWVYLTFQGLNPAYLYYKITDAKEQDGYVVLQVEWFYREGKAGPIQKDTRYFLEEDGRVVGANPIFIHTRGWLQKESKHFIYHFKPKQDPPTGGLLKKMDLFFEKVTGNLQVEYPFKIHYYQCDSAGEVGWLFDLEPSQARSQPMNGLAASTQEFAPHEIVHIISYQILPQNGKKLTPVYLDEGLAYYLGGASFLSSEQLIETAKKEIEVCDSISLLDLMHDPWAYGVNQSAALLCSLAKYLIEIHGMPKFKELFSAGESYDEQPEMIFEIYDQSIEQLQIEWKRFVLELPPKR